MAEERLISELVNRIAQQIPYRRGAKTQDELEQDALREQNENALAELSAYKLNVVAHGLCNHIERMLKATYTTEDAAVNGARGLLYLLNLLGRCLAHQWNHIKGQIKHVPTLDEEERIRIKEKEEQILPPSLEDAVAAQMFRHVAMLLTKQHPHLHKEITDASAFVLFQLSASNYDTLIGSINQIFASTASSSEEDTISQLNLIEHLNLKRERLMDLLSKINRAAPSIKKAGVQLALARVLRKAIWNWIDQYPMEFVQLCRAGVKLSPEPDSLFDIFDTWAGTSTSKRKEIWPIQTMLLILCPDIMLAIAQETSDAKQKTKDKFLDALKKSLKSTKLADVAAVCCVDICKASTFVSKSDMSALRYIVPAIEVELKERLFNPAQPFKGPDGQIDEDLMVDCLVSSFYLNARKVCNSLFADCLKPTTPKLFKFVLVRCLLRVATASGNLPWNPTISDVYDAHAANLRALFQECATSVSKVTDLSGASDKKSRQLIEGTKVDVDILTCLATLYSADPSIALKHSKASDEEDIQEIRSLLTALVMCATTLELTHVLTIESSKALLELHKAENISRWCSEASLVNGFWTIGSSVTISLANVLIEQKDLTSNQIQVLLTHLEAILRSRNEFLQQANMTRQPDPTSRELRSAASTKLEIALLTHICSGKPEIGSLCASCFGLLCTEVELVGDTGGDNAIAANYSAYKQLATTGQLATGRQAQQKALRGTLRKVEQKTQGNYSAWLEVLSRFRSYTERVLQAAEGDAATGAAGAGARAKKAPPVKGAQAPPPLDKRAAEVLQEWVNSLGFLLALSAVAVNQEVTVQVAGAKGKTTERQIMVLEELLENLLHLLVSDNVNVREPIKMLLGQALSPAAYPLFFRMLHGSVKKYFGSAGQVLLTDDAVLCFDQAISILKLILEAEHDADDFSLLTELEDVVMTMLKFVRQLTISVSSLQTKHKLCGLLEAMMSKRAQLSFRNEHNFRTELVNNVMEWTSEFSNKESSGQPGSGGGSGSGASGASGSSTGEAQEGAAKKQLDKVVKELDLQAMNAIAALLRGLPLQGDDDTAKSQAFSKLFTFFTRLLTRCKKEPHTVLTPQLPEVTILAVSYLVTANIQHGLEYFRIMGYHEDEETRSAFLRVLSNILNQGAEFDTGDESGDKYYKLLEIVMDRDLTLVLMLSDVVQITEADKVAQLLVRIFEANDKTMDLLKASISAEVAKTETANTLFRRNSVATKLLAAYCKLCGAEYLREALAPQIRLLITQGTSVGYELDETKLPAGQTLDENQANVTRACIAFLEDIQRSIPQCPRPFREISRFLKETVGEKFPGAEHTAVAGFMFLRFLCPAIIAPDGFGVIPTAVQDQNVRRALVLITKVLQNLANRVQFAKEPFMHCMNPFIEQRLKWMVELFDEYTLIPDESPLAAPITFSDEQKEDDLGELHLLLSTHLEKLARMVTSRNDSGMSAALNRLTSVLSQLGPPPEPSSKKTGAAVPFSRPVAAPKGHSDHFSKFMQEKANTNTEHLKDFGIYYQKGHTAKSKAPVFYYVARKYAANLDPDTLLYYIFKTTQPFFDKPWALVIDLTLFGKEHQLPYAACVKLAKFMPSVAQDNLEQVLLLYPNHFFKKYAKSISKLTARINKKIVFVTSLQQLGDIVPDYEKALPATTVSVERNVHDTFSPVTKVTQYGKKPCVVKIGTDMLHIITVKSHPIFNQSTVLIDLFHISRITEITKPSADDQDFVVTYDWAGQRSLSFRSPSASQIIQQLTATKDRFNLSRPQNTVSGTRAFSPSDVPGTLLNMSLLNITATNSTLRGAAYNLLAALCNTFSFGLRNSLLEADDLAIPRNVRHFVVRVSRELAANEPKLTLEFLLESLHGITKTITKSSPKAGQLLVLDYIRPWLHNLVYFSCLTAEPDSAALVEKTKEVVNSLIALTIREIGEMGPAIMTRVWKTIGRVPEAIDIVLACMLERAVPATSKSSPIGSKNMQTLEDIAITLAAENPSFVSGKLVHNLLRLLEDTRHDQAETLVDHRSWIAIEIYLRWLLMLSFDNLLAVELYLPELFHIVMMVFYTGNSLVRATTHRLFINIVHCIYTTHLCHESKQQALRFHLYEYQQLPFRLQFGIGGKNISPFSKPNPEEKLDSMPITVVENVANALLTTLSCCYQSAACLDTARHARWLSLTITQAFTPNPALQPRAVATLGVLCQNKDLVAEELIVLLLNKLKNALLRSVTTNIDDLSVAIIVCLSHMFEHLRPSSKFFRRFFWLVMSLLQIHDVKLFHASVVLLESILKALDENGCLKGQGLATYCMEARDATLEPHLSKLDQITGMSFKQQFSFAVAGHLLKGLRHATTKTTTTRVLSTLIDVCRENVGANVLGYLAALLPHRGDDMHLRFQTGLESADSNHQLLFNAQMVPDKMNAALLFTFLATILKGTDFDHEQLFIFQSFQEGIHFMPDAFSVTFETLVPKMVAMMLNSQNRVLLSSVLSVMNAIFYYALDSTAAATKLTPSYLATIQFAGLPISDQFMENANRQSVIKTVCSVIEAILA